MVKLEFGFLDDEAVIRVKATLDESGNHINIRDGGAERDGSSQN